MENTKKTEREFNRIKKDMFRTLEQLNVPISELEKDFENYLVPANNTRALRDFIWSQFNKHIGRMSHDFQFQAFTYSAMANFRHKYEGDRDTFELKKLSFQAMKMNDEHLIHSKIGRYNAHIIAFPDCCPACAVDKDRYIDLKEFLQMDILPHKDCTCIDYGCNCTYACTPKKSEDGTYVLNLEVLNSSDSKKVVKPSQLQQEGAKSILNIFNFFLKKK